MKSKELLPHYSGKLSYKFWDKVNSIYKGTKGTKGDRLYALGCKLQSLEYKILEQVNEEVSDGK